MAELNQMSLDGMSLIIAAVSDETTKERLNAMRMELGKIHTEQAALNAVAERNHHTLVTVQTERRVVEAKKLELLQREKAYEEKVASFTEMAKTHTEERAQWEAVRAQVEAQHSATYAAMKEFDETHLTSIAEFDVRERTVKEREALVAEREAAHERRVNALQAALDL